MKVSIITISFNSEKTIERTFQSVLAQKYRPLEYVLVDGCSKDKTISIIESYLPKFRKAGIEVNFKSEPDHGISDAFNKGILRAAGDIIGIINSDDQLSKDAVENIMEGFKQEVDVVCGDCLWVDEDRGMEYIRKSKMDLDRLKYDMVLMHPSCFVKKDTYKKYGMFDTDFKYAMDKELMARFYRKGATFYYVPKVIAIMSAGGVSDANPAPVIKEGYKIAVQNGVPKWKIGVYSNYKKIRLKAVAFLKKNKKLWLMIKRR